MRHLIGSSLLLIFTITLMSGCSSTGLGQVELQKQIEENGGIPADYTGAVFFIFHNAEQCRCSGIITMVAEEVFEDNFQADVEQGRILMRKLCIDDEENWHFCDMYGLYPDHLHNGNVLVHAVSGRLGEWKNLDRCDELKEDDFKYADYLIEEINSFIAVYHSCPK